MFPFLIAANTAFPLQTSSFLLPFVLHCLLTCTLNVLKSCHLNAEFTPDSSSQLRPPSSLMNSHASLIAYFPSRTIPENKMSGFWVLPTLRRFPPFFFIAPAVPPFPTFR